MKSPPMKVDLGELGEEELDFNADFTVSDLDEAILEQAARYDWYDSVYHILKRQYAKKSAYFDKVSAKRRRELADELPKKLGKKKATVADLNAALDEDAEVLTVKEELAELEHKMNRVKGHMSALGQHHSNLKELSRRERWRLSNTSENLEDAEERAMDRLEGKKNNTERKAR